MTLFRVLSIIFITFSLQVSQGYAQEYTKSRWVEVPFNTNNGGLVFKIRQIFYGGEEIGQELAVRNKNSYRTCAAGGVINDQNVNINFGEGQRIPEGVLIYLEPNEVAYVAGFMAWYENSLWQAQFRYWLCR